MRARIRRWRRDQLDRYDERVAEGRTPWAAAGSLVFTLVVIVAAAALHYWFIAAFQVPALVLAAWEWQEMWAATGRAKARAAAEVE